MAAESINFKESQFVGLDTPHFTRAAAGPELLFAAVFGCAALLKKGPRGIYKTCSSRGWTNRCEPIFCPMPKSDPYIRRCVAPHWRKGSVAFGMVGRQTLSDRQIIGEAQGVFG